MKRYFVVSDIHSFYTPLIIGLNKAGFDIKNKNHILVVNGDIFDRGDDTLEVYKFIKHIPKSRRILIKGNHEDLFLRLLDKKFPQSHDFSNGTVNTFCSIAKKNEDYLNPRYFSYDTYAPADLMAEQDKRWNIIKEKVEKSSITKWLRSNEWINYFEIDRYIITHSFIPVRVIRNEANAYIVNYPAYTVHESCLEAIPNWRTETLEVDWKEARWGCPWRLFNAGIFNDEIKNGKVLICGHWHAADFHYEYENAIADNFDIYFGDNLIAIDSCTALTYKCNVLVIDENFDCYSEGRKLSVLPKIETVTK